MLERIVTCIPNVGIEYKKKVKTQSVILFMMYLF